MKFAILFGGESYEHEISIVSAITVGRLLRSTPLYIFLDTDGNLYEIPNSKLNSKLFKSREYQKEKRLSFISGGFTTTGFFKKEFKGYTLLNLIHGGQGEDGVISGLLEFFKIPYIGPRKEASTLSYNKHLTKIFADSIGIKTVNYEILYLGEERRLQKLSYPVIVKPLSLGSSLGVKVAKSDEEFQYALDVAFEYDNGVIIEDYIEGVREYNLAGIETDKFTLSMIEEPQKGGDILDFEKKYLDFSRDSAVLEADIDNDLKLQIKDSFKKVYSPLFRGSLIRCDFFVISDEVYLNEINSIPGSMANYLFNDFETVLTELSQNLPNVGNISVKYEYIDSIQSSKGK
jgi:D-alanine-D-alanine ligase